ncbi:MAG TPA: sigma-70 family RNA polymerase sigma factor [Isosphaeraceae bacterium]|nr:sigma-70 family RNA polymerase sigma factor [Isosphaeraceae bacterium]
MNERSDDQELVEASRAGTPEAFGVLVRRYQNRLYPTLLRLTGSPDDACDLLQDAFLRAYEKLDCFQGESSFYTWIYRIAVNLALSDRRKRKVAGRSPKSFDAEMAEPSSDAASSDPSLPLERAEREQRIVEALGQLHPDQRAVIVLKDLDGQRYDEIAALLRIPIGTVRSRLHRARSELRILLKDLFEETPTPATSRSTE